MKTLIFDTETTGKDPVLQDIIQLAYIIEVDGVVKEEGNLKMRPFKPENVQSEALAVNMMTMEQIQAFPDPHLQYLQFVATLGRYCDKFDKTDKFYPAGYNIGFDIDFLNNFFKKNNDPYFGSWCNWRFLDPRPFLYLMDYQGTIGLPDYKLATICQHLGIPIDAHDALSDIRATKKVIAKVIPGILLPINGEFKNPKEGESGK